MSANEMIRKLRIAANISQDELARRVGYNDRSSIAKIETGKVELSESKLKIFAKALKTTPSVLMGLDEPDEAPDSVAGQILELDALNETTRQLVEAVCALSNDEAELLTNIVKLIKERG